MSESIISWEGFSSKHSPSLTAEQELRVWGALVMESAPNVAQKKEKWTLDIRFLGWIHGKDSQALAQLPRALVESPKPRGCGTWGMGQF